MMLDAYSLLRCRYLLIPTSLVDIVNNSRRVSMKPFQFKHILFSISKS